MNIDISSVVWVCFFLVISEITVFTCITINCYDVWIMSGCNASRSAELRIGAEYKVRQRTLTELGCWVTVVH